MLLLSRSWIVAVTASLAVAGTACQQKTAERPAEKQAPAVADVRAPADEQPAEQPAQSEPKVPPTAAVPKKKVESPPPPATIPKVALSDAIRAACVVNVGDTMPAAELPDAAGKMQALESLYGQKLTVVCFWTNGNTLRAGKVAGECLHDLKNLAKQFGEKGVRVVGINVGDTPEAVEKQLGPTDAAFPNLLDPKGEVFAKVARDKRMPRPYLLDSGGRILWFDVECRRQSREQLVQAIRVVLGEL